MQQTRIWHLRDDGDTDRNSAGVWKHFLFYFLPGLFSVVRGRLSFVGLEPRSVEVMLTLPQDWLKLCRDSKIGLISEPRVQFGGGGTTEERQTAEAVLCGDFQLAARHLIVVGLCDVSSAWPAREWETASDNGGHNGRYLFQSVRRLLFWFVQRDMRLCQVITGQLPSGITVAIGL